MRRIMLMMAAMGATVLLASGVAYALNVQCDGTDDQDPVIGQCQGTNQDDEISGTDQPDSIRALNGFDDVFAGAGEDELYGGNLADVLDGERDGDTYFGGKGSDYLREEDFPSSGKDVMNGGPNNDALEGGGGADILRGQAGDERGDSGFPGDIAMYGYLGDDKLYGGTGDDGMEGEEGSDEHYGGPDNDYINAADSESVDTPDLVDGGDGYDVCIVNENDDPVENCERIETEPNPTAATTAAGAR